MGAVTYIIRGWTKKYLQKTGVAHVLDGVFWVIVGFGGALALMEAQRAAMVATWVGLECVGDGTCSSFLDDFLRGMGYTHVLNLPWYYFSW